MTGVQELTLGAALASHARVASRVSRGAVPSPANPPSGATPASVPRHANRVSPPSGATRASVPRRATRAIAAGHAVVALRAIGVSLLLLASTPVVALAHGEVPPEPTLGTLVFAWSLDPIFWAVVILAGLAYWLTADRVDRRHPANPVPRWRRWSWLAGLGVIVVALASPIEAYDTTLFSVHMVQHLLLAMVAAPLLVLGAPVTLLLRASSSETRRRRILPVLHSRLVRVVSSPAVGWVAFAAVMWFSHFSPLFDAALEDDLVHRGEHALFLGAGLLFWWPVVGADPAPNRLSHPARILYLALGMPFSSLLGLVIFSARTVLYPHYATLERDWGMTPLEDQAWAGGIMWAGGDLVFVVALVLAVAAWLRHEQRAAEREDARAARRASQQRGTV